MTQPECEGACEEHRGAVKRVRVWSNPHSTGNGRYWGEFMYCESAIQIDKEKGFVVLGVKDE